jgi:hypothetical protein
MTSNDKISWTSWQQVSSGSLIGGSPSRYLEYKFELKSTNNSITPRIQRVIANYTAVVTNASGDYKYNFTNPTSYGIYPVVVNTTYRSIFTQASEYLLVQIGVNPTVSLVSPSTGLWFSQGNLTLVYNASDINNNIVNATLVINGRYNMTNSSFVNNSIYSNFSINFTSGQYNWTVNITDSTNLRGTAGQRTFYIDLIDPNVSLVAPVNNSSYALSQVDLVFNVTDNMDTSLTCDVVLDGSVIHNDISASSGANTSRSSGSLSSGLHYWNVTCWDNVNRQHTSPTWIINISDTPPSLNLGWPYVNYVDTDGNISFIFNATDNSGFKNCSLIINGIFN